AGEVPDPFLEIMRREQEWTAGRLTADQVRYLEELPEDIFWDLEGVRIHAFHATPTNLFTAVLPDASAEVLEGRLMVKPAVDVYVYGHIHLPYVRYLRGKCVVNTGSVGLPFDGLPQPSYALLEVETGRFRVTLERVPYDADRAAERLRQVDYPNLQMMRVIREAISPFG
ncbi:MAG TPA: metallophosphoesterase family protein, partial [Alicyclobacillus sp.]|nr:metallophosphoesterase family protein [Alicyclobacillus sp.]